MALLPNPICANIPPSCNLTHGPGVSGTYDMYSTIDDSHRVVHMEGIDIPGANINYTQTEDTRGLGLDRR